jgi:ATP-dependent DNA helicase RecG
MYNAQELEELINELRANKKEAEWFEFKMNFDKLTFGENVSAISNTACLHDKDMGYIIFGVDDATKSILGTKFDPDKEQIKGQELENWLTTQLDPRVNFKFHKVEMEGVQLVVCAIDAARLYPVKFRDVAYIRVGSYTKKLKDHEDKERILWEKLGKKKFETEFAYTSRDFNDVLGKIDYSAFFAMIDEPVPKTPEGIKDKLVQEKIIQVAYGSFKITNMGAILFANDINDFGELSRKSLRVIVYKGNGRVGAATSDYTGKKGYAVGFKSMIDYVEALLPQNELIEAAIRTNAKVYPTVAIREIIANALIHQDFSIDGTGPLIEIFDNRIEITNPGNPLIEVNRFIDHPPQSRNEKTAFLMRRLGICEERGSGVDRVIQLSEVYQLPAPDFQNDEGYTRVTLFAPKSLRQMSKNDKTRAAYQHCCLLYLSGRSYDNYMSNESLRKRLDIEDKNYPVASRIITDTIDQDLIKPFDPDMKANKHQKYVPYWA